MNRVIWLNEALEDLKEIGRYIPEEGPAAAYQVLTRIKTSADSLQHHPELGRPGRVENTRELIISDLPYILPYTIEKKEVRILAAMHTARKWPDDFSK